MHDTGLPHEHDDVYAEPSRFRHLASVRSGDGAAEPPLHLGLRSRIAVRPPPGVPVAPNEVLFIESADDGDGDDWSDLPPPFVRLVLDQRQCWSRVVGGRRGEGVRSVALGGALWARLGVRPGERVYLDTVRDLPTAVTARLTPTVRLTPTLRDAVQAELVGLADPFFPGQILSVVPRRGVRMPFKVSAVEPAVALIDDRTEIIWSEADRAAARLPATLADVGGLEAAIGRLRDLVALPLLTPDVFRSLGVVPPRGVLLHGPPGTGKTLLCRCLADELGVNNLMVAAPELTGSAQGETEANLRELTARAVASAPCLVVIDEFDTIGVRRDQMASQHDIRVAAQLLALMDGLGDVDGVVFLATTNRPDAIDVAFRRPGRFEEEIYIGPPDEVARRDILSIHTRSVPVADDDLDYVASRTVGLVGADLMHVARMACLEAVRRTGLDVETPAQDEGGTTARLRAVTRADFDRALSTTTASRLRSRKGPVTRAGWDELVGIDDVKSRLVDASRIVLGERASLRQGILVVGPPGSGKTAVAEALAAEIEANLVTLDGSEVFTQWLGESESAIKQAFEHARQFQPSVLVLDHLDAIAGRRGTGSAVDHTSDRVVAALLNGIDTVLSSGAVVVVGVTDRPDLLDPAVTRSGRLGLRVHLDHPDEAQRAVLVRRELDRAGLAQDEARVAALVEHTREWSRSDFAVRSGELRDAR
jgi:transitional endoplasmic reticulum ATPase